MLTKSPGGSFDVKDSIFASKNILTRKSDYPTTYSIAITSYLNLIYISAHPNSFVKSTYFLVRLPNPLAPVNLLP